MPSKTFTTPGPVRLDLEIQAGRIELETAAGEETHVDLEPLGDSDLARELVESARIDMRERRNRYEVGVQVRQRGGIWTTLGREPEVRLRISCPPGADLEVRAKSASMEARGEYGSVDVKTVSGDVQVQEVGGEARVKTASGNIALAQVGDKLDVNSVSGDLSAGVVGGEANVQLVSGDATIVDARSSLRVTTVSGDHRLEAVMAGRVNLKAVSGDVSVGVRQGSRVFVDANTVSGTTSSELELSDSPGDDDGGEDGPLVELFVKSVSGDIRIERAPALTTSLEAP